MLQDNPQTTPASQVDLLAVDALFRRLAERGRKIRAQKQPQVIDDKERTLEPQKSMSLTKDNHNTKQAGK
jgi:hypothetical protein